MKVKWFQLYKKRIHCVFITQYTLVVDEAPSAVFDTWMLSRSERGEMWYDKLNKDDSLVQNLKQASEKVTDAQCLVMSKVSESEPKFSLKVQDCNEKHPVVCRVEPQQIADLTDTPKFPCLAPNQVNRRKRTPDYESYQENQSNTGLLVQMLKHYTRNEFFKND